MISERLLNDWPDIVPKRNSIALVPVRYAEGASPTIWPLGLGLPGKNTLVWG